MKYSKIILAAAGLVALLVQAVAAEDAGPRVHPEAPVMHKISKTGSERATSGGGGKIATRDGKTHFVWQDSAAPEAGGYLNRIRTLDRGTGELSPTVTLNHPKDNHARPNLVVDPDGYLHAILSGHNSPVTHMRSERPNDASSWTDPVEIDEGTYPIPVAGPDGTLYLTMRSAERWNGVNFYVKPPDGEWTKRAHLVRRDPEMNGYAAFASGLALDDNDTLHAVIDFYESAGVWDRRGLHQAIAYMRSDDGGRTWTTSNGDPVELPARPERMDIIARDRAQARHEDKPPPVIVSAGALALDDRQRPHILYIDHRVGPGQIMHATPAGGRSAVGRDGEAATESAVGDGWRRQPVDAIERAFPGHRPTHTRGSLTRAADGTLYALLELVPLDEGWSNGLPTRGMMKMDLDKRLAWLVSNDGGRTWAAAEALQGDDFNQPNVERPMGGNQLPEKAAPPFVFFAGELHYPEKGEVIDNDVYLAVPETKLAETAPEDATDSVSTRPSPYASRDAWREAVGEAKKRYAGHPAFAWPEPDPSLQNVLLIGDSISIGYTREVRRRLEGVANVFRVPDNARSTRQTLDRIETYLGRRQWDVIHFNWGIHDITLVDDAGESDPEGKPQIGPQQYEDNLARLVRRLKATRAELIWASTTPVADDVRVRDNGRIEDYNATAAELMDRHFVTVNDLHAVVAGAGESWWKGGVHFNEAGSEALGRATADAIRRRLGLNEVQSLLTAELMPKEIPRDDGDPFTWKLPLRNPDTSPPIRASITAAEDNGPAWSISAEPETLRLEPGESGALTIRAEADPERARYPLSEVVLAITSGTDGGDSAPRTYTARKLLDVAGSRPRLAIASSESPPRVDGVLDDPIWQDAPTVPMFGRMDFQRRIGPNTSAWLTYDREHLYIAYRCDEPTMDALDPSSMTGERDGKVWADDSVELLFGPKANFPEFYHIIVNARGAVYDARNKDRGFDIEKMSVAADRGGKAWTVEMAIPWASLDVSEPPEELRLLLARNREAGDTPATFQYPVSPAGNRLPENFGRVGLE